MSDSKLHTNKWKYLAPILMAILIPISFFAVCRAPVAEADLNVVVQPSYTIFVGNGDYYAKNGAGSITYQSTDIGVLLNHMPVDAQVLISDGNYTMHSQFVPKNGQNITGESESRVVITGFTTSTVYALIDGMVNGVTLSNFTFNANNTNPSAMQTPNAGVGINLIGNGNAVEDVTLYNAYLQGILMGNYNSLASHNDNVIDCQVYYTGNDGIALDNCVNSVVQYCDIHNTYGSAAGGVCVAYQCSNCSVIGCNANNTAYGFGTDNTLGTEETLINFVDCCSQDARVNGLLLDGGTGIQVISCTSIDYYQYGFSTFTNPTTDTFPSEVTFIHCTAQGNGTSHSSSTPTGFMLGGGSQINVDSCSSYNNILGLWTTAMNGPISVTDSIFSNNTVHDVMGTSNSCSIILFGDMFESSSGNYFDATTAMQVSLEP